MHTLLIAGCYVLGNAGVEGEWASPCCSCKPSTDLQLCAAPPVIQGSGFGRSAQVAGVRVSLFQHALRHGTPDAVFPNNWFTTHPAGEARGGVQRSTLALYPLKCPNRRAPERNQLGAKAVVLGLLLTDVACRIWTGI